jgi:hypothetical protein
LGESPICSEALPETSQHAEGVKRSKRFVGKALPNNLLTAINKKSWLLDGGKCDSSHTPTEAQTAKTTQSNRSG